MKKTQWIELFASIRSTKVSFFAMTLFIALAISIYLGLGWTGYSTELSLSAYLEDNNVRDVDITCPTGVSQETIDTLLKDERVLAAEGSQYAYGHFTHEGVRYQTSLRMISQNMDKLHVQEGTLPRGDDEIAVSALWADKNGLAVGDTITFEKDDPGILNTSTLKNRSFTITALVTSSVLACTAVIQPSCMLDGTSVDVDMYLPSAAFTTDNALAGTTSSVAATASDTTPAIAATAADTTRYTSILLRATSTQGLMFDSDEYNENTAQFKDEMIAELERITGQTGAFVGATRTQLPHMGTGKIVKDVFLNLRSSLAILFLVIGFLVCYCTITRLIQQQSQLIGEQKALGFSTSQLIKRYLCYTGIAVVLGSIVGVALALIIEKILVGVVGTVYLLDALCWYYSIPEALGLVLLEAVVLLCITFFSVRKTCRRSAIDLLSGKTPVSSKTPFGRRAKRKTQANAAAGNPGKSKTPMKHARPSAPRWSTFQQTIISNCLNDKKRVISTLIAVAGCTALIVTAVTFYCNVCFSPNVHFTEYFHFDSLVFFDENSTSAQEELDSTLSDMGIDHALVYSSAGMIEGPDSSLASIRTIVNLDDKDFSRFVTIKPAYDNTLDTTTGFWLSHTFKNYYGEDTPESFTIVQSDNTELVVPSYDSYLSHITNYFLFCDKDTYEHELDCELAANAYILDAQGVDANELQACLSEVDGFASYLNVQEVVQNNMNTFVAVVSAISAVYLVMSLIMGFLVLLNVLVQFVDEKRRELTTMMAMGFKRKQVRKMIYSDTILLTIVGIIPGLIIGYIISYFAIGSFDSINLSFIKSVYVPALVAGVLGTSLISFIMCKIAMKRIDTFKVKDLDTIL